MNFKIIDNVNVVDTETGEVMELEKLAEHELTEEELVGLMIASKEYVNKLRIISSMIESRFLVHMQTKEATKYEDDNVKINIQNKNDYEYNTEIIDSIREAIGDELFNKIFTKQYKVNRTNLKSLTAMGGESKHRMEEATKVFPKKPYVKITKK